MRATNDDGTPDVDESRRGMALALLSAFGGAALIKGCAPEGAADGTQPYDPEEPNLGEAPAALTGATSVRWFDTYSELRGVSGGTNTTDVNVAVGRDLKIGGVFAWTTDTTTADDGGIVIVPSGMRTGCWKRVYSGAINVYWFGAAGDGTTNDTDAVQDSVAAAAGSTVEFPEGTFKVCDTVPVAANTRILGTGGTIKMDFASDHTTSYLFDTTSGGISFDGLKFTGNGVDTSSENKYVIAFRGSSGSHISDCRVERCDFSDLEWINVSSSNPLACHAVYASYCDRFTVNDNTFRTIGGAAVFVAGCSAIQICRNRIDNTGWYSIQLQYECDGWLIEGNRITGSVSGRRDWGGSINVMSNGSAGPGLGLGRCQNGVIRNNYISGYHSYNAAIYVQSATNVVIDGNTIEDYVASTGALGTATEANYIRCRVRPNAGETDDEGIVTRLTIVSNQLAANGTNCIGIHVDNKRFGSNVGGGEGLRIANNQIVSIDTSNYFKKAISVYAGQQGGWTGVSIANNYCTGFPSDSTPVEGLVGVKGYDATYTLDGAVIIGNELICVGGTPSSSTHLGIAAAAYANDVTVSENIVSGFAYGIRSLANVGPTYFGRNYFNGNITADYLQSAAVTSPTLQDSVVVGVAGQGLKVKEGTNATAGLATLVAGTVTVSTTKVTASSRIQLTPQTAGGTPGFVGVSARTAGTSFTITSSSAGDTSQVAWLIVEPA